MTHHSRSNSFPSRSHPVTSEVDEHLSRLSSSESASTSSSSLCQKLNGVQDLHECIERLLLLPLNQQALTHEQHRKCADELLNGSIKLFDVCTTAKDALLQTKECIQELQSVLRRRRGTEITQEVRKYLGSRKAMKKAILKALKNLKNKEDKCNETAAIFNILREAQAVTFNVMESLLLFVCGLQAGSKTSCWSAVSKLLQKKKLVCEEGEESENEIANAEAMIGGKKIIQIENAQTELQEAESCIQDLEEGLETIFRQLIKARVTILNILNH